MLINSKILSLPPFISTSWDNVRSLNWDRGTDLVVTLIDGNKVVIPQLPIPLLHIIFKAHSDYLETRVVSAPASGQGSMLDGLNFLKESFGEINMGEMKLDELGELDTPFQHNPQQADFPDLPESLLNKMSTLLKVVGIEQFDSMPKAEPHCNCLFCQVSRTVHRLRDELPEEASVTADEEIVTDEDLRFKEWDIQQIDDKRYQVSNPLDPTETFQVYLGNPVGCNCGNPNCEHIKAVLKS